MMKLCGSNNNIEKRHFLENICIAKDKDNGVFVGEKHDDSAMLSNQCPYIHNRRKTKGWVGIGDVTNRPADC